MKLESELVLLFGDCIMFEMFEQHMNGWLREGRKKERKEKCAIEWKTVNGISVAL